MVMKAGVAKSRKEAKRSGIEERLRKNAFLFVNKRAHKWSQSVIAHRPARRCSFFPLHASMIVIYIR